VELFPCTIFKNISGFQLFRVYKIRSKHPGYMHLKYCCTTPGGLMDRNKDSVALGKTSLVSRTIQRPEPILGDGKIYIF
jgi:hypothetical protein